MRFVVLVVAVAALGAGSAAGAAGPSPFPLALRIAWNLADENGNVLEIRSTRASAAYVLRGLPGLSSVRVRAQGQDVEAWDARNARWEPFLRLGASTGTQYTVDLAGSPLWRSLRVKVSRAPCDAADRTVRGCVTLGLLARKPVADAGVEKLVFAPGIGPVEVVVQTIAGPRTYTLDGTAQRS